MSTLLTEVSPTAALGVFTLGLLLIYVELNRPGRVIPGAVGLLLTLLACARLGEAHPRVGAVLVVGTGAAVLGMDLVEATGKVVSAWATAMLVVGFHLLLWPAVGWMMCILCGVALGGVTAALSGLARRARANKREKSIPREVVFRL